MEIRAYGDISMYAIVTEKDDTPALEYCWVAWHPELPGCIADGRTEAEAIAYLHELTPEYLESFRERGVPIPVPNSDLSVTR